jgi:4-amino-4-deoxy-L-arabinose transferase-like glycosyltransferase
VTLVVAAAFWCVHVGVAVWAPGGPLLSFDSAQYALAGRHLAEHGRLATPFAYVGTLRAGAGPPYPLLAGHPLLPLLLAPLFKLLGAHAWVTLVPMAVCYLLTVACGMELVLVSGGSALLAGVVGVALATTPSMLANAIDGLSELPFAAAWTAAMLVLTRFRRAPQPLWLGACLGLAHLARPVVVPALPLWLAAVALASEPGRRLRNMAVALAGFSAFAASLLLYKWRATGNPFSDVAGIMLLTQLAPEFQPHDVTRLLHPPDALSWIRAHPDALVRKLASSLPFMAGQVLRLGGWITGLAFVTWIVRPRADGDGPMRLAAGGSLLALTLLAAATLPRSQYLFPMVPAAVAFGALTLERLGRALRLPPGVPITIVAAILSWSSLRFAVIEWADLYRTTRPPPRFAERDVERLGAALAARRPERTLVASDMAPWVSWYARRPSVTMPVTVADLDELRARHGVTAVLITNEWMISLPGNEPWRQAFEGTHVPPGWHAAEMFAHGRLRARLLLPD